MLEFIKTHPLFVFAAIFAVLLIIGIVKRAMRLLVWSAIIFVILVIVGIVQQGDILNWFKNLFKGVG